MTKQKVITIRDVDLTAVLEQLAYTVPVGMELTVLSVLVKKNNTTGANGDGSIDVVAQDYGQIMSSSTAGLGLDAGTSKKFDVEDAPILAAGKTLTIVTTADTGDNFNVDIEIVCMLSGNNVAGSDLPAYTDVGSVANYLGVTIPEDMNDQVEEWILAMSRYADRYTNRQLFNDTPSTRLFDGDGRDVQVIDDCCEISAVLLNGSAVEVIEYPQAKEYTSRIVPVDGSRWPRGRANVSVTGVFAMSTTLQPDVKQAVTVLVAGIYNARNSQGKVGTTETIGDYSVTYREASQKVDFETAKTTLSSYRRVAL